MSNHTPKKPKKRMVPVQEHLGQINLKLEYLHQILQQTQRVIVELARLTDTYQELFGEADPPPTETPADSPPSPEDDQREHPGSEQ